MSKKRSLLLFLRLNRRIKVWLRNLQISLKFNKWAVGETEVEKMRKKLEKLW